MRVGALLWWVWWEVVQTLVAVVETEVMVSLWGQFVEVVVRVEVVA